MAIGCYQNKYWTGTGPVISLGRAGVSLWPLAATKMKDTKVQTLSAVQSFAHECSRTAIQDTLKPWCLGSYADL